MTEECLDGAAQAPIIHEDETVDRLSRTLRIIQKKRGHRAASDDVFLAWIAARVCPQAERVLDLGSGKGTVALLLTRSLPRCRVVGVEALAQSHDLAQRNALLNGVQARYSPRLGDLRDPAVLAGEPPFDLITGAPPFMPVGSGTLPRDPQRAAGRFELRGGVREYALTAANHLAPQGTVVLLMDGLDRSRERAEEAFASVGLHPRLTVAVRPRPGRSPVYWILAAGRKAGPDVEESLCMRPASGGAWTGDYDAIRQAMDLPS